MKIQKRPIKIVIIDSGVDTSVSDINKYLVKSTGFKINEEGYIVEDSLKEIRHLHGTVISLIIRQLCEYVQFISMNILNERLTADGRVLLYAMGKAVLYKPDIIHLSLGTTNWRYIFQIKKLIRKASRNNILIVSSLDNDGEKSYPACLKGVVGVKADTSAKFHTFGFEGDYFYAPFRADGISGMNEIAANDHFAGTSISAAHITGHFANEMYYGNINSVKKIINHMKSISLNNLN